LPRGLKIGCTLTDVENAFGLKEADGDGIFYGDRQNAPYAVVDNLGNGIKALTLAAPARETDSVGFS
jgi:hypothetical protein